MSPAVEPDPNPQGVIRQLNLKSKLDAYFKQNTFTSKAYIIELAKGFHEVGSYQKLGSILSQTGKDSVRIREVEKGSIDYLVSKEYEIKKNELQQGKTRKFKKP